MLSNKAFVLALLAFASATAGAGESTCAAVFGAAGRRPERVLSRRSRGRAPGADLGFRAAPGRRFSCRQQRRRDLAHGKVHAACLAAGRNDRARGARRAGRRPPWNHGNVVGNRRARFGPPGDHGQRARDPRIRGCGQDPCRNHDGAADVSARKVVWQRRRIDGAPGYFLSVEVLSGSVASGAEQSIEFLPDAEDRLRLRIVALTGEAPLTPMAERELLTSAAAPDPRLRSVLTYLSFHEKLLAGSWRFDTYFGRDTLMSLRLLSPVLKAPAMEAGLGSVLRAAERRRGSRSRGRHRRIRDPAARCAPAFRRATRRFSTTR